MKANNDEIIEIYNGTLWESEMITSLLEDSEIQSFLRNNILESYVTEPIYSTGVKVMILASDFEKAKEVVDSYRLNSKK